MISFLSISNSEDYADVSELDGTIGFHEVISCHDVVAIQPGPRRYESAWPGPQHPPPSPSSSPLLDNPEQRLGASNANEKQWEASVACGRLGCFMLDVMRVIAIGPSRSGEAARPDSAVRKNSQEKPRTWHASWS